MAFHHRKLLDESYEDPILEQYCLNIFCDVIKNPNGTCPLKCTSICDPSNCIIPIEIPPPTTDLQKHHHKQISLFLTISLSILATVVFFFICYATYKLYSRWYNSRRRRRFEEEPSPDAFLDEDHGPPMVDHHIWYIRTIGLQPSVISAITIVKYKKGEGIIEGTDCSVCLNEFQEEETLRLLPKCNHAFHIPCIDTWLASHTNCPICRAGIIINSTTLIPNTEPEEVIAPNSEQNGEQVVEGSAGVEEHMDSRAMSRSVSFDSFNVGTKNVGINQRLFRMVTITNEEGSLVKPSSSSSSSSSSSMKRSISCSAKV